MFAVLVRTTMDSRLEVHMQSSENRRRLMREHFDEQPRPIVAVLKCAAGIAILVAIAAGPWLVLSAGGSDTTAEAGQKSAADVSAPIAESRRVFEERRQRVASPPESTKSALAK